MSVAPSFDGTDRTIGDRKIALVAAPALLVGFVLGVVTFVAWA
jgi:hypothetical protein